jgi:DNA-dependent metalloprotease WSS1
MNHSRAFWAVRNQYAEQMRGLWMKGYTGEGIWGRGTLLETGEFQNNTVSPTEILPEHLCGGTFRSRGRKRKLKPKLSYKEQKERRILKKFGANGVALGADDEVKVKLENGKKTQAKPRVAGSARGRELRAAAALARFEVNKKEDDLVEAKEESEESDYEDDPVDVDSKDAIDIDGKKLLDGKGRGLIKVCEDENPDDVDAQNELQELRRVNWRQLPLKPNAEGSGVKRDSASSSRMSSGVRPTPKEPIRRTPTIKAEDDDDSVVIVSPGNRKDIQTETQPRDPSPVAPVDSNPDTCAVCSFANTPEALTCMVCSNVLDPESMPGAWRCQSSTCKDSKYLNPADYGVCGVCGTSR